MIWTNFSLLYSPFIYLFILHLGLIFVQEFCNRRELISISELVLVWKEMISVYWSWILDFFSPFIPVPAWTYGSGHSYSGLVRMNLEFNAHFWPPAQDNERHWKTPKNWRGSIGERVGEPDIWRKAKGFPRLSFFSLEKERPRTCLVSVSTPKEDGSWGDEDTLFSKGFLVLVQEAVGTRQFRGNSFWV